MYNRRPRNTDQCTSDCSSVHQTPPPNYRHLLKKIHTRLMVNSVRTPDILWPSLVRVSSPLALSLCITPLKVLEQQQSSNLRRTCHREDLQTVQTTFSVHTTSLSEREGLSMHLGIFFVTCNPCVGKTTLSSHFPLFSPNKPCTDAWAIQTAAMSAIAKGPKRPE